MSLERPWPATGGRSESARTASRGRRLLPRPSLHGLVRLLLTAAVLGGAIGVVEALNGVVRPSPALSVLMVAVVLAALTARTPLGLLAAGAASGYLAWHLAQPGFPPHWTADDQIRVIEFTPSAFFVATVVGLLQRQMARRVLREREHRERMAQLERIKAEFLNLASHELRGPLAVLRGYASLIEGGDFGPLDGADMRRAGPVLTAKIGEMTLLVDRMLETARLEESQLTLTTEQLDLRDVVQHAVQSVAPLATPAHELRWEPPRDPVTVLGDPVRLGIIVTNLVHNAVKYSPDGGVVQCFLGTVDGSAVLTVWDQGLGIAEADLPRLFTRFGRLVTPENSHIPGTGLGLHLARELARMHGGDIVASSAVDRGSVFTVTVPLPAPPRS